MRSRNSFRCLRARSSDGGSGGSGDFQQTRLWQSVRERFAASVPAEGLPHSLLARFQGPSCQERLVQLLRFVCPLSTARVIK